MIVLTAVALNTMMFLLVVRVDDPLVPRAIFGILNTLLFFPSGAVYPIQAFPWWLRGIAKVDPVHFRRTWLQDLAAEGSWPVGHRSGHDLFLAVRGGSAQHSHAILQANTVSQRHPERSIAFRLRNAMRSRRTPTVPPLGPAWGFPPRPNSGRKGTEPSASCSKGILRLRDCFAKRSSHSAQDDNGELLPASANLLCLEYYDSARCHTIRSGTGAPPQDQDSRLL